MQLTQLHGLQLHLHAWFGNLSLLLFVQRKWATFALAYSSLGIIYGDIGTSPLYTFATTLQSDDNGPTPSQQDILGVSSLIFWIMTLVVLVKYVLIVLKADDNGEGEGSH